jgi:glycosyltransferase involved in cell wall biosynthesis
VHLLGAVADAIPVVKHFAVGVLCSESEGFSNAVMEYMGCGVPSVCTNVGGNGELIRDGETGYLVRPFDVDSLADRIDRLLSQRDAAEAMAVRAQSAARRFTSARMAERHMAIYEDVLAMPLPSAASA